MAVGIPAELGSPGTANWGPYIFVLSILFFGRLVRLLKSGMNWTVAVTCVESANADASELSYVQNDPGSIGARSLCNVQSGSSCSSCLPFFLFL